MAECFVFVDESGDLGEKGSRFLVLAALIISDSKPLDRIIRNMRRHKFRKELKTAAEIKANHSSKELIRHMLAKMNGLNNARAVYVLLEKRKLLSEYLKNDKHKLYNYVAGRLARNIGLHDESIEVHIDKSKGKPVLQEDFNEYFSKNLCCINAKAKVSISHSYSHAWSGLQFADVLAWACFQKFEHSNPEFTDLLKIEQEVFHVW